MDLTELVEKHAELAIQRYKTLDLIASGVPLLFVDIYNDLGHAATLVCYNREDWPRLFGMVKILRPSVVVATVDSYVSINPEMESYRHGSFHERFTAGDKSISEAFNISVASTDGKPEARMVPYTRDDDGKRTIQESEFEGPDSLSGAVPDLITASLQHLEAPVGFEDEFFNAPFNLNDMFICVKKPGRWCNINFKDDVWKSVGDGDIISGHIPSRIINPAALNGKKFRQLFDVEV